MVAYYKGAEVVFQIEDPTVPDSYVTIACMRSTSLSINNEPIDVTSKCSMPWKTLIEGGVRSMAVSGSGVYNDDASMGHLIAEVMAGTIFNGKVIFGNGDEFLGPWHPTSEERSGEHADAEQYSFSLDSAGVIEFTAGTPPAP